MICFWKTILTPVKSPSEKRQTTPLFSSSKWTSKQHLLEFMSYCLSKHTFPCVTYQWQEFSKFKKSYHKIVLLNQSTNSVHFFIQLCDLLCWTVSAWWVLKFLEGTAIIPLPVWWKEVSNPPTDGSTDCWPRLTYFPNNSHGTIGLGWRTEISKRELSVKESEHPCIRGLSIPLSLLFLHTTTLFPIV